MNFLETVKDAAKKVVFDAAVKIGQTAEYIDEHPSMVYAGLIGLSIAVGINHADTKNDLKEIKDMLE